jgi:hypothetical protein
VPLFACRTDSVATRLLYNARNWWGNWELNDWFRETVKKTTGQGRRWEEAMPGVTRSIQSVRDACWYDNARLYQIEEAK